MQGDPNVGSSSSSGIKKRKKTSKVWDEMRKYTDTDRNVKAECKHCRKTFDGSSTKGTTHLKNHLERCPDNPNRKSGSDGRNGNDQDQSLSPSIKTKELARLIKEKSVRDLITHFSSTEGDTNDEERKDWLDWLGLDPWVLNSRKDEILQLYQEEKEKLCQFLNNLSCRFTLQLVCCNRAMDRLCLLKIIYIDDSWEVQIESISFWQRPGDHIKNLTEAVKESCMDWKIDTNICFLDLSLKIDPADGLDNEIGKMESWFSQRSSLPFAGCLLDMEDLRDYVDRVLRSEDYVRNDSTATSEHLKFLDDVTKSFFWWSREIPIIVDLPYVHKILTDRCNHKIEDCLFCEKVMKAAIDLFFSKDYLVRVIGVILDPRFKMDGVQLHYKKIYGSDADRYLEKVNKDFRDVYDAYAAPDSSNSKSYAMLDAVGRPSSPKSELDLYMKELKVPAVRWFDKLAWWRANAPFYPTLARMARDYLAMEAPYVPKIDAVALKRDRDYFNGFGIDELPKIIPPLLCLKGLLGSAEN